MLTKIATKISQKLLLDHIINEEMLDVYIYGFELLLSFIANATGIIIIGFLTKSIVSTLTFLLVFISLRNITGGFHAKTYIMCTIVTLCAYGICLVLSHFVAISEFGYACLAIIGIITLAFLAPVDHPYKKVNQKRKRKFKVISIGLFICYIIIGIYMIEVNMAVCSILFFSLVSVLVLLFFANKKKGGKSNAYS